MSADLVGLREIAERLGVRANTLAVRRHRNPDILPEPVTHISGQPVWDWNDVETWVAGDDA